MNTFLASRLLGGLAVLLVGAPTFAEPEPRPQPVLLDSVGQEVGPMVESHSVVIESDGAFLLLNPERQGWHGGTTYHLAADCSDAPTWLKDAMDPLAGSGFLYDFSTVNENLDLFAFDSRSEAALIWDPAEQGSLPRVYRAFDGGCEVDTFLSGSASNQQLTWYLIPLRFVVNLNEAYPPPLHVELRPHIAMGTPPITSGCGVGPELALALPALWWLRRVRRQAQL